MFSHANFRDFLSSNYDDEIYDALAQDDKSEVVMKILCILRETFYFELIKLNTLVKSKSNLCSTERRNEGNNAYRDGLYQRALALYNEALLYAPKGSREMILAYSNRSALFHKLKAWTASYNDINQVFAMGCPRDIEEKLNKRKNDAISCLNMQNFSKSIMSLAAERIIDRSAITCNTQIPCTSADIKIVPTAGMPKVVAATNIKVGAVLASEQAYVSHTVLVNSAFSCHYCQKIELNLIPCDGCCYALFCNDECKTKCIREYHEYECNIIGFTRELDPKTNLVFKSCLKLQKSCKSWDEFIATSYNMGSGRIKSASIQEIYDTNNKYSVLCCSDDKTFVYGVLHNVAIVAALLLFWVENRMPSFFPKGMDKKNQAMRALARVMMFLSVYQKHLFIMQAHDNIKLERSSYGPENYGVFPFISKLKNSCNPNSIVANNNNKLVVIAISPIRSGEELTVSFLIHRHEEKDMSKQLINLRRFMLLGTVCGCHRCSNSSSETKYEGVRAASLEESEKLPPRHVIRRMLDEVVDDAVAAARCKQEEMKAITYYLEHRMREDTEVALDAMEMVEEAVSIATGQTLPRVKRPEYHYFMKRIHEDVIERNEPSGPTCPQELPSEIRRRAEEEAARADPTCRCDSDGKKSKVKFGLETMTTDDILKLLPTELRLLEEMRRCKCDTATESHVTDRSPFTDGYTTTDTVGEEHNEEEEFGQ